MGFAVNAKSLKAGLAGALVIAFVAGQAVAQEADCPKVGAEANVKTLGIAYYPPGAKTVGNFVPAVTVGKVMYLAGDGPKMPDGKFVIGKLGSGPGQLERGAGLPGMEVRCHQHAFGDKGGTWRPQQGEAHCKSTRDGQLRSCVHRTAEGDQRG